MLRISSVLSLVFLFGSLAACSSNSGSGGPAPRLTLEAVSKNGCLNIQELSHILNHPRFRPETLTTTTQLDIQSEARLRSRFVTNLTMGVFAHQRGVNNGFYEFRDLQQLDCQTVTAKSIDSSDVTYKVLEHAANKIVFSGENNMRYEIAFIEPALLRFSYRYETYDFNCSTEEKPITVSYTENIHFAVEGGTLPTEETLEPSLVSRLIDLPFETPALLKLREAGRDAAVLLSNAELEEIRSLTPPPDAFDCGGFL